MRQKGINGRGKRIMGRKDNGFTIIEMMTIIAVVGILATVAGYNVTRSMPDYRLRQATRRLASMMQLARLRAINSNTECHLEFGIGTSSPGDRFYTFYLDRNSNGQFDVGEDTATRMDMDSIDDPQFDDVRSKLPSELALGLRLPVGVSFGGGSATKRPTSGDAPPSSGIGIPFGGTRLVFNHRGSADFNAGIYFENNKDNSWAITIVQTTGRIRVWHWEDGDWA
jgi:prepilin-type N-terminal cleavage/methylation domain-containing protein